MGRIFLKFTKINNLKIYMLIQNKYNIFKKINKCLFFFIILLFILKYLKAENSSLLSKMINHTLTSISIFPFYTDLIF